jgi:dCMP deaminase
MKGVLIVYIPVLHKGYLDLFARHSDCKELHIIGEEIYRDLDHIARKDIRRVEPSEMQKAIEALHIFDKVLVLNKANLESLSRRAAKLEIIMSDDEISREVAKSFGVENIIWDTVFLRWHRDNVEAENKLEAIGNISHDEFDKKIIDLAKSEGGRSADWYRQVGAVLVHDGEVVMSANNKHMPGEMAPYEVGDPRSVFRRGVNIELGSSIHSEAAIISEAAKRGMSTEGCVIYVTDFPCPPCAKLIAGSGIKKLFFEKGYALLDGEEVLKSAGVEVVRVV